MKYHFGKSGRWRTRAGTLLGALLLGSLLAGGCAPARRKGTVGEAASPDAAADGDAASRFQALILPADYRTAGLPSREAPTDDELAASKSQPTETGIRFDQVVQFGGREMVSVDDHVPERRDRRPLFIVWDQDVLGDRIEAANFESHTFVDARNHPTQDFRGDPVFRDAVTGRWFIPLSTVFGADPNSIDPSLTYILSLEFWMKGDQRVRLEISLRGYGSLPDAQPRYQPMGMVGTPAQDEGEMRARGWEVRREEFVNPTTRPLNLWVQGRGAFTLKSYLAVTRYDPGAVVGTELAIGSHLEYWLSQARMSLDGLRVYRGHREPGAEGPELALPLSESGWTQVPLKPHETIQLAWLAHAEVGTPTCSVPGPETRQFSWTTHHQRCFGSGRGNKDCEIIDDPHSTQRTESWSLDAVVLEGQLNRKIYLAGAGVPMQPGIARGTDVRLLVDGQDLALDPALNGQPGLVERGHLLDCQGLF